MKDPDTPSSFSVRAVSWKDEASVLSAIRTKVFVDEQNVPVELELDGQDETAEHFLAELDDGTPVGTARLLASGQIGRLAVLLPYRRFGIGNALMLEATAAAKERGDPEIFLHAQIQATKVYERIGFVRRGPEFDDAGIPHVEMVLEE